jgi:parallel beta-helix repeat protein
MRRLCWLLLTLACACGETDPTAPVELQRTTVVTHLVVSPDTFRLAPGDTASGTCTLLNKFDKRVVGDCTWASRNAAVATVRGNRFGHVQAVGAGLTWVVASGAGFQDSAQVRVVAAGPVWSADCTGTPVQPGDSLQAAVNAGTTGTVFCLAAGVYRMQSVTPKSNQVFMGVPGQTVLTGAKVLTGFAGSGPWSVGGQTQENAYNPNYNCEPGHDGCFYPEQLWVDDSLQEHVTSLAAVVPGTWYFDYGADVIYLGTNPSGHVVETSVTPVAFKGTASGVHLVHLVVQRYASDGQQGAVNANSAPGWVLEANEFRQNKGAGFRLGSSGRATGNYSHHNGQLGYACGGADVVIEGNEIAYNNTAYFGNGHYASFGAGKCALTTNLVFRNNYSHHNRGPGAWTDINNVGCLYEGNRLDSNYSRGLFHEISYACVIRNNVIRWNGFLNTGNKVSAGDRAGIVLADSRDVEVYGNTVEGNVNGIMCIDAARDASHPSDLGVHNPENLWIHDNTVVQPTGRAGGCADSDPNHDPTTAAANNRWDRNRYTLSATTKFRWLGNLDTMWLGWRGAGQDPNGSETGQ